MKILAFGDTLENEKVLKRLSDMDFSDYEFVLFTGDILNLASFKKLREKKVLAGKISGIEKRRIKELKEDTEPKEILKIKAGVLQKLVKYFKKINQKVPFYGVFGNADHRWIVGQTDIEEYFNNLHLRKITYNNYSLIGYEGRSKYVFETYDNSSERAFKENESYDGLARLFSKNNTRTILVTHAPPYGILDQVKEEYRKYAIGTYGKKAKGGHIGSLAFQKITQIFKPKLHVFGHIHENRGTQYINGTTFINTGSFGEEEEFVEIDISNVGPCEVKFKRLS